MNFGASQARLFTNSDWRDNLVADPDLADTADMPHSDFQAFIDALPYLLSHSTAEPWEIDPAFDYDEALRDAAAYR